MGLLSDHQLSEYRRPLLLIACIQAFLSSGIFYGWASLYTLFLDIGVYRSMCDVDESVCVAQKDALTFIYTVASSVNLCSQLPWGFILDTLGPRVCNLWSTTIVIGGFTLLSLSARGHVDAYMLAMCLIAGGGPGAQISLFHLSELFPTKHKAVVLSIIAGAFQMGFVVFACFKMIYEYSSLSLSTISMMYCIPLVLLLLCGGVIWPDQPCIPPDDLDPMCFSARRPSVSLQLTEEAGLLGYQQSKREWTQTKGVERVSDKSNDDATTRKSSWLQQSPFVATIKHASSHPLNLRQSHADMVVSSDNDDMDTPRAHDQLRGHRNAVEESPDSGYGTMPSASSSPSLHHAHRSLHALRASEMNPNLKGATADGNFLEQLRSPTYILCAVWMTVCLFWANFFIGTIVDQLYARTHGDLALSQRYTSIFTWCLPAGIVGTGLFGVITSEIGFGATIGTTSLLAIGYSAMTQFAPLVFQPIAFVLYALHRSFLFSVMFAFLAHEYGYRHFGLLSGIVLAGSGAVGLAQYTLQRSLIAHNHSSSTSIGDDDKSFDTINRLQLLTLIASLYFAIYVTWTQQRRSKRVKEQIEYHTTQLKGGMTI